MRSPHDPDKRTDSTGSANTAKNTENRSTRPPYKAFAAALVGVLLAGITPNPPVSWLGWVQLVGASLMTGIATTLAVHDPWGSGRLRLGNWLPDRIRRSRPWLIVGMLVTAVVVALAAPPLFGPLRGVYHHVFGCPPATQLRMVAQPETIVTAREIAASYERSTAEKGGGCPSVRIFVFQAPAASIRAKLGSGDGWSGSGGLREIGPQPDVWLASTGHEVDALTTAGAPGPVVDRVTVARSPLVLAVRAPAEQPDLGWPELLRDLTDRGQRVVRPDPASGELGLLATALLYRVPGANSSASTDASPADSEVERRIDYALDSADLLCSLRDNPEEAQAAISTSEQEVARFNSGMPIGGACGRGPVAQARRLVALYPTDTADQDLQFVRLGWSDPVQQTAATAFGKWLLGDDGGAALVRTGLRPAHSPAFSAPLTTDFGVDPTRSPSSQPLAAERWTAAETAYPTARRPSRLLFLLDTSGSMDAQETDGPRGRRGQIAADAVRTGLTRLGAHDEFGLWLFPGESRSDYTEAVPVGPRTDARAADAGRALNEVRPGGRTPLLQTMIDGATAVPEDDGIGVRALIVLTDGEDNVGATKASDTARTVAGLGVQVVVVTLGEARCSGGGLPTIVGATGGDCEDADPATVEGLMQNVVNRLRGGR